MQRAFLIPVNEPGPRFTASKSISFSLSLLSKKLFLSFSIISEDLPGKASPKINFSNSVS